MAASGTRQAAGNTARPIAVPAVALGALAAVGVALLTAWLTGATSPWLLVDPGIGVRWGIVAARVVADLAAALTVGLLVLAAVALPAPEPGQAHRPAMTAAAAAATVWAFAALVLLVLTFADISGLPLSEPAFGSELLSFTLSEDLFRGLGLTVVSAAAIGLVAAGTATMRAAGLLALLAVVTLVPTALAGHAAGSTDHETAVTALGLHILGVSVWVGGLAALLLVSRTLAPRQTGLAAARYSMLAAWSFAAVALSGLISAWLRLGGFDGLSSAYGAVLIAKTLALLALGAAGFWHRRVTLVALDAGRPRAFLRLASAEVLLMGVAMGLGAALARTAPPAGETARALTPAESLTGYPLPPELTAARWLTEWRPDLFWVIAVLLGAGFYLTAVRRVRARGDAWPVGRTIAWLAGLALLGYVTSGPPAVYGRVLFSAHMVAHMTLSMAVPILLVLGGPATLALRALRPRGDGSRGPREWLVAVLGSAAFRVLTFAPVAGVLFAGSLVLFYWTGLFELALTTHVGHVLMNVHFLLAGYLFASVLIGIDPMPHRPPYPMRLLLLFATMAFHAFLGVALVSGTTVLQPGFFSALGRDWGRPLLEDQQYGGGLAWGFGELPTIVLALILVFQWSRSDDREARRHDRAADRDGDADLAAYNAMLADLAARDRPRR